MYPFEILAWETEVRGLGVQGQPQIHGQPGLHENCKYSSTDKAITKCSNYTKEFLKIYVTLSIWWRQNKCIHVVSSDHLELELYNYRQYSANQCEW